MDGKKGNPALLIGFGETEPKGDDMGSDEDSSPGTLAGKAFAKAAASGDGASVYEAFKAMIREFEAELGPDEPVDEEPMPA
jgi:hypothetical protein